MLGKNPLIRSYVVVDEGCTLAVNSEGNDHVQIVFGDRPDPFELVVHHGILRTLIQQGADTLQKIDDADPEDDNGDR